MNAFKCRSRQQSPPKPPGASGRTRTHTCWYCKEGFAFDAGRPLQQGLQRLRHTSTLLRRFYFPFCIPLTIHNTCLCSPLTSQPHSRSYLCVIPFIVATRALTVYKPTCISRIVSQDVSYPIDHFAFPVKLISSLSRALTCCSTIYPYPNHRYGFCRRYKGMRPGVWVYPRAVQVE